MDAGLLERVRERLAGEGLEPAFAHGLLAVPVPRERLLSVVKMLRDGFGFDLFLDVTAVDWPGRDPRFDVVFHFYSTRGHQRVRLKTTVTEADPVVDSVHLRDLSGPLRSSIMGQASGCSFERASSSFQAYRSIAISSDDAGSSRS